MKKLLIAIGSAFLATQVIYWCNLDTKLVKLLEKPMMRHYDSLPRDNRL
ncbi:MAG: hypothetical protein HUJ66_08395 [Oscillospiraceae bacterium]|nr:hypothetical protein [Oscillospiraceae bacterium]